MDKDEILYLEHQIDITSALDWGTVEQMLGILRCLRENGYTEIWHDGDAATVSLLKELKCKMRPKDPYHTTRLDVIEEDSHSG